MNKFELKKLKQDIVFDVTLRGRMMQFHSTWGLFSPRKIDDGSYKLIENIEVAPTDVTLDIGCGYGPIGVAIGMACPEGEVHMVDKDFLAVQYAAQNAELNHVANTTAYVSNALSEVPRGMKFDNIVSNLPANVGKEMLSIILHDAKTHLKDGGKICVVTVAGLRKFIRRNFEEVFGNYDKIKQGKTYTVAQAFKE